MKCIDCKFCAFINESSETMTVKSNGFESSWPSMAGGYCMRTSCTMFEVEECSGYKKSKHKKMKSL